jgi:hypothetical protein
MPRPAAASSCTASKNSFSNRANLRNIRVYQEALRQDPNNLHQFYLGKLYYRLEMVDGFDILDRRRIR